MKSLLLEGYGHEMLCLLEEEMNKSLKTGVFEARKREFLHKIGTPSENDLYWDVTF